jgi:uncharacterized protein with von Willebrand factor type A (vWA) domain
MSSLLTNLVRFGRLLHDAGADVQAGRMIEVVRALEWIDISRRQDFYCTLRGLLVHRVEDLALFDEAFRVFWRAPRGERTKLDIRSLGEERRFGKPEVEMPSLREDSGETGGDTDGRPPERVLLRTYSNREILRHKDFEKLTPEELEKARELMAELRWQPGLRRSRRWTKGAGGSPDLRRLLRTALRSQGETFDVPSRVRKEKPRPIVLLCDVSGSMERYTRMLLQFAYCLSKGFEQVEAFLFATRLTRVTLQMRRGRMDRTLSALSSHVPDWSGGTRIGDALRTFHVHWARRVLVHGPVVLLVSDGWDRGDPAILAAEMARLRRACSRLIWLNPLLGTAEYQPLTRGMQAALPHVDDFLPVHNLASLESLARHLNALPARRGDAARRSARRARLC